MAEAEKRVTRASSRSKDSKTRKDKDKAMASSQLEMAAVTQDKVVACASETKSSVQSEDHPQKKVTSTRKKRPSAKDETEKESIKLSKNCSDASSKSNNIDADSKNDVSNNEKQIKSDSVNDTKDIHAQVEVVTEAKNKGSKTRKDTDKTMASSQLEMAAVTQDKVAACASENKSSVQTEDHQQKKVTSTRKKRPSAKDETEKENIKLSKNCADASSKSNNIDSKNDVSTNKKQIKSDSVNDTKAIHAQVEEVTEAKEEPAPFDSVRATSESLKKACKHVVHATNFNKILGDNLEKSQKVPSLPGTTIPMRSKNIYHYIINSELGKSVGNHSQVVTRKLARHLSNYEVADNAHPFRCRITSIEWHPRRHNFIGVGSKHGDMVFYTVKSGDYARLEVVQKYDGVGPGGSIPIMKFHPTEDNMIYTSSLCGKVMLRDVEGRRSDVLQDTLSLDFWYTSLDVHKTDFLVCAGRNKGHTILIDKSGKLIWEKRLHTSKISHLEFSPRDPNLLCTASMDRTVRLWDLRKMVDKCPMEVLFHNQGLNSASFSLTDGLRLLTTDQKDELRVYGGPLWRCEKSIKHPHRFFQHITPIKAYWHPHKDIILCGRYPDRVNLPEFNEQRSIDMFDASTGERLGELKDTLFDGIVSSVKVNQGATKVLCAMGYNLNLWNNEATFVSEELSTGEVDALRRSRSRVARDVRGRGRDGSFQRYAKKDKRDYRKREIPVESEIRQRGLIVPPINPVRTKQEEGNWFTRLFKWKNNKNTKK